ncbi:MAG: IPT/TIG domain-containing protein [Ignavibacteriae bacterium]|nr:IPT/TIG domain-containing protein [Ignavibacteriota bacterium]
MKRLVQSTFIFFVILSTLGAFAFGQKLDRTTQEVGNPNEVFAAPTVTSFSPSSGSGGTLVTVNGTNLTGATAIAVNGVSVSSFTVLSATQITMTLSDNNTTGKVSVTTSGGTGLSNSDFTVFPRIDSFSPTSGPRGSTVIITGGNFSGVTSVKFNGTTATFTRNSATQITATVPTRATSGKVTLATSSSSTQSSSAFTILFPPNISRFSPTRGAAGASVTIIGSGFDIATAVSFNGASASFTIISSTQINATVPANATKGKISVTNAAGTDLSGTSFTVLPGVTSFSPTSGVAGDVVTITGTGFTTVRSVKFNGITATFTANSENSITAVVPSRATTGEITVTTSAGTATSPENFSIFPNITSFTPSSGPVGTTVNITGTNFTGATSVTFNGVSATFSVRSSTSIRATVPSGAGSGSIQVTTAAGTAESATDFTVTGSTTGLAISSFSPSSGNVGATVVITGTGFSDVTDVLFNGVSASFTVSSSTSISAVVPTAASIGQISVSTSSDFATSSSSFSVLPQLTSFTPSSGATGSSVVITGSGLSGTNSVKFNGVSAGFTINSANQVTATVPSSASTGKISLTTPSGTVTSSTNFTVTGAPVITSFSPSSSTTGATITILGANFTGASVQFNGVAASATVVSSSQITAVVPSTATTGYITVTTSLGSSNSSTTFTVLPSITSFSPTSGTTGSTVVISGSGFSGVTSVRFNDVSASFTVNSVNQITATVPSSATTGPVRVVTTAGSAPSNTNFTVTSPLTPPTVSSFSPTSGTVGTTITINGTNFSDASGVQFNGTNATSFTVASSTQITATVPTGASTGKISVINPSGTGTSSSSFTVTAGPSIATFTPTSGPVGTVVSITGANLSSVTNVLFNGVSATTFTIISSTTISATVPADGSTGKITLVASSGNVVSTGTFSVTPQLTSFTPTSGTSGTSVVISGSGFIGATSVKFNGVSSTFTLNSATQITAVVPSGTTTGKIAVTTTSGTATSASDFTITAPPTVTSFTPNRGATGTVVSIFGSNLTATSVTFNGVSATFTNVSSTQITATVPGTATTGKIVVTTASGTVMTTNNFTVTPTLSSFTPTSGTIGSSITITGTGFSSVTAVRFNNVIASYTVNSSTEITATVPSGATTGPVSVTTSSGTATGGTNYTVLPNITTFAPTSGVVGNTVFITGTGFTNVTSVLLNGVAVTYTVQSSTSIRAVVPVGATSGSFTVTTTAGTTFSAGTYTVIPPISITSFTPACSEILTQVTVTGTSFISVTEVLIDTSFCLFTVNSSTELVLTVPATATTGRIKVISSIGTAESATDFVPVNVPDVTSFSPTSGPVGTTVILTGTGFCTTTSVDFNGVTTSFTIDSDVQITTVVPYGATTGPITVVNTVGTFTTASDYTVTPDILSFTPASGYVGDNVTITGTNFLTVGTVEFNGVSATFTVDSYSQITATVPATATTGLITVTSPTEGTDASSTAYIVLPKIDSFTPTTGIVGDAVTINGSGLNNATSVTFNGTSAGYTVVSESQVDAFVPFGALTGSIVITTPYGTATSSSYFNVEPNITGFTPVNGVVGDNVTIFGSAFIGTTDVQFNGTSATFTIDSYSQITATVPSNASTGVITVTTTSGTDNSATNFTVLPNITSFTPTSGVIGSSVNISGTTLTAVTDVDFNGTSATFTVLSDVLINATVPNGATTGPISVTNPDGTDYSATDFTVLPDVSSFTPTAGIVGDNITINGTGFTGATDVQFNGVSCSFTVNSDIDITATVPNLATTGVVTVTTPSGTNSSTSNFTVQPNIDSFTPLSDIVGASVTITGTAFTGATSVAFNGVNASYTVNSYSQITATVPATATTGAITVVTPSGTATSATNFAVEPNITSFSPTSGVITDVVTILGTNFTGATDVSFNGVSAITFTVVSATQIDATVPSGASTGLISVTTPDGTDFSATNFTVEPDVTSFTPSSGEVGDPITLNGTGFTGATSVLFNGVSASFTVNSDIDISATVPNNATTGTVSVTTPSGTGTSSTNFTVLPTILSFTPAGGVVGSSVTITGTAFTGATAVAFNGVNASYTVNSYSQITATVPSGATTGTITVTTAAGTATSATNFSVGPNITSFSPTSGVVGDVVTILGTNFTGATDVAFDGTSAVAFTVVSSTQIDATVPTGATTGLIEVTTPDGNDFSATNFSVTPEITSFTPSTEQVGMPVVLTGTSFTGATSVTFNGTSASFTVDSDVQITATVPNGTTDGVIAVTTPSGTGTSTTSFGIEPDVTGFAPSSGIAGTSVVITGTGFTGTTVVNFNGTNASFTLNSYTQITATVPAGATTGNIGVTNLSGNDIMGTFTVPPTISGFSPSSDVIGSVVTITGTNLTGATAVSVNGVAVITYTVVSSTQIDATVPASATTGLISVTTPSGTVNSSSSFTVLPNITGFSSATGTVGASRTINGSAFTGATSVTFNGVSASFSVSSSTAITATVPSGATTGPVTVTTAAGTATSASNFTVTPSISSFAPTSGAEGASITINGQAFTGTTSVAFNGTNASFTFVSNTQLTATVPVGATTGTIVVTTPSGSGTSGSNFSVAPAISSLTVSSGVIGSTFSIIGTSFTGVTFVRINGVSVGGANFTVVSTTQIDVTVPAGATSGLVSVTTAGGTASSAGSFTVLPNITGFSVASGVVGTSITINGSAFTGASSVKFNSVSASYSVSSSTAITATVPSGATTGSVTVTTAAGTATSSTFFTVPPSIASFAPGNGVVGASITITGEAFTGVTSVTFNGTSAVFTFNSNTSVTATVPSGATDGNIQLTTPSGTATSGVAFDVLPKLAILDNLHAMLVVDAKGIEQRIFFGGVADADVVLAKKYELGPVMKGIFDVRFAPQAEGSNGKLVEMFSNTQKKNIEYRLQISSATYPLTLHFDKSKSQFSSIRISSMKDGVPVNPIELKKSGSITIEDESVKELLLEIGEGEPLPTEFALKQNYPNPFNPSTTIRFAVPGTYWVSLKVYNMLGEEVAELINEQREQGNYEMEWNAVDVPSGVYTYRLLAFDIANRSNVAYTEVKKMLMLK